MGLLLLITFVRFPLATVIGLPILEAADQMLTEARAEIALERELADNQ